jgi:hypothetical protein
MQSAFQQIGVVNGELQTLHDFRFVGLHRRVRWLEAGVKENLGAYHGTSQDFGVGVYHEDIQYDIQIYIPICSLILTTSLWIWHRGNLLAAKMGW